ncbi:hypothetical protein TL16_g08753 [Triparma laevis f. inornata]|uniref:Carotenoid oxygenase n=1 Tax=Triparma laevis f. inornata TaxID=1714386 RepID=A0A9W7EJ70_9STRA|nr:hypothetical protein TL16_g08753 [Triparma laevis f. inornata]
MNALFLPQPPSPPHLLPTTLPIIGTIARIGPNGSGEGFLDADGMLTTLTFLGNGSTIFYRDYVDTLGRKNEAMFNKKYEGTLKASRYGGYSMLISLFKNFIKFKNYPQKDTCNTSLGKIGNTWYAKMEQSLPSSLSFLKSGTFKTVESFTRINNTLLNSNPISGGALSAHSRYDPETDETFSITYGSEPPFLRLDVYSSDKHTSYPINIPTPVMVHDLTISSQFVIILDFPLTLRPRRLITNEFPVAYEPSNGARIGLFNRKKKDVEWFEVESCVVLHLCGCFETKEGIEITGLRSEPSSESSYILNYTPAYLHKWSIDLKSKNFIEKRLNSQQLEFPVTKGENCYCLKTHSIQGPLLEHVSPKDGILLNGIAKYNLKSGKLLKEYTLPKNSWAVSEVSLFHSYVGIFVSEVEISSDYKKLEDNMKSFFYVFDEELEVVEVIDLKDKKVNYGLHSAFIEEEDLV